MRLSIIIPALNEEKYLPGLLKSIQAQNYPCEVIVADAQSNDATKMIAKAFGCKVVPARKGLPSYARNAGAKFAKGEVLLFLDADVLLPKDFLKKNVKEMEMKKLDVATCFIRPISRNPFDWFLMFFAVNTWFLLFQKLNPSAIGFCIFSKRSAYEKLKGFDETITFGEDSAFFKEAKRKGLSYGMLFGKIIPFSVRRFDKQGRVNLTLQYISLTLMRFGGEIRENVGYSFGGYEGLYKDFKRHYQILKKILGKNFKFDAFTKPFKK